MEKKYKYRHFGGMRCIDTLDLQIDLFIRQLLYLKIDFICVPIRCSRLFKTSRQKKVYNEFQTIFYFYIFFYTNNLHR